MEIRITEKNLIELKINGQAIGYNWVNGAEEILTPFELDRLIDKLKQASKEARNKQKGIKI